MTLNPRTAHEIAAKVRGGFGREKEFSIASI